MRNIIVASLLGSTLLSQGCKNEQPAVTKAELQIHLSQLLHRITDNLIFVEGGTFTMGDFGAVSQDGVWRPYFPPTIDEDLPHQVTLSDYSMSSQKTTWSDFDTYLLANDFLVVERVFSDLRDRAPYAQETADRFFVDKPAKTTWQEAKNYCQWLGQQTQLSLDLPTSAQWEFAARNRGSKEWVFSTHDGKRLQDNIVLAWHVYETGEFVPVGSRLPANPLGLYDMADNGKEWVNDWFSETYYQENPQITDPQGPDDGSRKVIRNLDFSFSRVGASESVPSGYNEESLILTYTFRCALQSPIPASKLTP